MHYIVKLILNKKVIHGPLDINAKDDAGVGFICGVYLHFLPWQVGKKVSFEVEPLRSANQFLYGVRLGYADPSVAHNLFGDVDVNPTTMIKRLEGLAAERHAYIYYHAPASHMADNYASQKLNMANQANSLAKLLGNAITSKEFQFSQLQNQAQAYSNAPPGETSDERDIRITKLNEALTQINSIQQRPGDQIPVRLPGAVGGALSEFQTLSDLAGFLNVPYQGGASQILHNIAHAAHGIPSKHIQRQVAGALQSFAHHSLHIPKTIKQKIPLAEVKKKPRTVLIPRGVRISVGKSLQQKPSAKYPLLPPRFLNVSLRAAPLPNYFKPSGESGIRGFLEHAVFSNNPQAQRAWISSTANKLNGIEDEGAFKAALKEALGKLNKGGTDELISRLKQKRVEDTLKTKIPKVQVPTGPGPMEYEESSFQTYNRQQEIKASAQAKAAQDAIDKAAAAKAQQEELERKQLPDNFGLLGLFGEHEHNPHSQAATPTPPRSGRPLSNSGRVNGVARPLSDAAPAGNPFASVSRGQTFSLQPSAFERKQDAPAQARHVPMEEDEFFDTDEAHESFSALPQNPYSIGERAQPAENVPQAPERRGVFVPPPFIPGQLPEHNGAWGVPVSSRSSSPTQSELADVDYTLQVEGAKAEHRRKVQQARAAYERDNAHSPNYRLQRRAFNPSGHGLRKLLAAHLISARGYRQPAKTRKINHKLVAGQIARAAHKGQWHPQHSNALLRSLAFFRDE